MQKIDLSVFYKDEPMKVEGYLEIETQAGVLEMPVFILQSTNKTRFMACGAQHSTEYSGSDGIMRAIHDLRNVDPSEVNGSIVLIPVSDVYGYPHRVMNHSQLDGTNFNRSYPGAPDADTIAERLAYVIGEIAKTADWVADTHGGDLNEYILRYAEINDSGDPVQNQKSWDMVACFPGLENICETIEGTDYAYHNHNSLHQLASAHGAGAAIIEAGGIGVSDEESLEYFHQGIMKCLRRFGIYGKASEEDLKKRKIWKSNYIYTIHRWHECKFVSYKNAGEYVKKGDKIAAFFNYFDDEIDAIYSPCDGVISCSNQCRGVDADTQLYQIIDRTLGEFIEA